MDQRIVELSDGNSMDVWPLHNKKVQVRALYEADGNRLFLEFTATLDQADREDAFFRRITDLKTEVENPDTLSYFRRDGLWLYYRNIMFIKEAV